MSAGNVGLSVERRTLHLGGLFLMDQSSYGLGATQGITNWIWEATVAVTSGGIITTTVAITATVVQSSQRGGSSSGERR